MREARAQQRYSYAAESNKLGRAKVLQAHAELEASRKAKNNKGDGVGGEQVAATAADSHTEAVLTRTNTHTSAHTLEGGGGQKYSDGFRGSPQSFLLQVLNPENLALQRASPPELWSSSSSSSSSSSKHAQE